MPLGSLCANRLCRLAPISPVNGQGRCLRLPYGKACQALFLLPPGDYRDKLVKGVESFLVAKQPPNMEGVYWGRPPGGLRTLVRRRPRDVRVVTSRSVPSWQYSHRLAGTGCSLWSERGGYICRGFGLPCLSPRDRLCALGSTRPLPINKSNAR